MGIVKQSRRENLTVEISPLLSPEQVQMGKKLGICPDPSQPVTIKPDITLPTLLHKQPAQILMMHPRIEGSKIMPEPPCPFPTRSDIGTIGEHFNGISTQHLILHFEHGFHWRSSGIRRTYSNTQRNTFRYLILSCKVKVTIGIYFKHLIVFCSKTIDKNEFMLIRLILVRNRKFPGHKTVRIITPHQ